MATVAPSLLGDCWHERLFAGGWSAGGGGLAPVREPATGEELGRVALADPGDVRSSCARVAGAQPAWAATPYDERAAILRRAHALLLEHAGEAREWLVREAGATRGKAAAECGGAANELLEAAALPARPLGHLLPTRVAGRTSMARRVPLGVVAVITPWNAPLVLALRSLAPALALGNAVVLKPDPRTAVVGGLLIARLLEEAGLPGDVLHVLPGGAEVGEALVRDPQVAMVSFTGSTEAGRRVGALAGEGLKRVGLELGGNNALLVLDDADVEVASSIGAWSSYLHQGQICMCAGRHLVHRSLAEPYAEALTRRAAALRAGDPRADPAVQLGPIIDERQLARVRRIVAESVAAGARIRTGGEPDGPFYPATVLDGVTPDMPAFREEIFGPVAPIVPFEDDEEAVGLVRESGYGLVAAICTAAPGRGRAIGDRLGTGIVHVNDHTINSEAHTPFGGVGLSGNGARFGGEANLEQFTQWRWVTARDEARATMF